MKTMESFLKATHRQGGTIHQCISYCNMHCNRESITFKQGLSNGNSYQVKGSINEIKHPHIAYMDIPINSFSNPGIQIIDYIGGLLESGIN